jgi:hypothetical protein
MSPTFSGKAGGIPGRVFRMNSHEDLREKGPTAPGFARHPCRTPSSGGGGLPAARAWVPSSSRTLADKARRPCRTAAGSVEAPVPPGTARHTVPLSCREGRSAVCLHCAAHRPGVLPGGTRGQVSWCSSRVAYTVPGFFWEHPRRRSPKGEAKRRGLQRVDYMKALHLPLHWLLTTTPTAQEVRTCSCNPIMRSVATHTLA